MTAPWESIGKLFLFEFLFEAGALAGARAQVVKTRPARFGVSFHFDLLNARGAGEEGALHTDAIAGYPAYGKGGVYSSGSDAQNGAFEFLNALAVASLILTCTLTASPGYSSGMLALTGATTDLNTSSIISPEIIAFAPIGAEEDFTINIWLHKK